MLIGTVILWFGVVVRVMLVLGRTGLAGVARGRGEREERLRVSCACKNLDSR